MLGRVTPGARSGAFAALVLGVVVLLLDPGWTGGITCAIPDAARSGNACWGADARLVLYVLTWVARALARNPARLFDPPIGHPAPGALTGSEHLLASQMLFGPLHALTRNPVLAANLTTLTSYWLGGLATFALLRSWDVSWVAALLGALIGMLGPLQLPPDLHVLQYPSWCLPLVLLVATWTRDAPSRRRVAALSAAITLAIFASYQIAVNVALLAAILAGHELFFARADWRRVAGIASPSSLRSPCSPSPRCPISVASPRCGITSGSTSPRLPASQGWRSSSGGAKCDGRSSHSQRWPWCGAGRPRPVSGRRSPSDSLRR